jgi:energy-coupling factor transport system permease protein
MAAFAQPVLGTAASRLNPVSKMAAVAIQSVALLLSIDWVSAAIAVVLNLILFTWAGLGWSQFWKRTFPIWIAAFVAALTTSLYGRVSGTVHFHLWFITVSDGSIALGIATGLRVLAIGLPGIVLFATTDPTDLADGMAQLLKLPARFVLGGLAGVRLVGLFIDDWRQLSLARRARGVADVGGWVQHLQRFLGQAFALLVLSIRRGTKLATAMEAKGFGAPVERTWARPSVLRVGDAALVATSLLISVAAIAGAVAAGTWVFVLSNR